MSLVQERVAMTRVSYWQVFRLIFVMFSLYLMGDAFYRWDGFRYYGSLPEFLPSVALVTILWSIVAVFTAILVLLLFKALEWFCLRLNWNIRSEQLLLFVGVFALLGVIVWVGKRRMWPAASTVFQVKLAVFLGVTLSAIFLAWLLRKKAERWISVIHERITPLVWLFGIIVMLSVPLVVYYTWGKQTDNVISQKITQPSISDKARPNIILVTFDAMTARDMSVYDYHRPTTPFISKWTKTASLFTRAQADSNFTTPAVASLMTGKRVWTHHTYHLNGSKPVKSNIENLPLVLKNSGYYNMAFVVNPYASVKRLGVDNSFKIDLITSELMTPRSLAGWGLVMIRVSLYKLFAGKIKLYDWIVKEDFAFHRVLFVMSRNISKTNVPPENAFNEFLEIIDKNPPEPFFAWIHLFPTHDPYLPLDPFMGMFDSSSELRTLKSQERLRLKLEPYNYQSKYRQHFSQETQPTIDIMRARYDEFIRYCDKQFEGFILKIKERNKLEDTVIILSSDHGESFEHNYFQHGGVHLYEQVTHIPLIIKESGQTKGRIINNLVGQIDIPPTILELANIPVPSWMESRSLVPLMRGKSLSSRPALSMALQKNFGFGHQITKGTIAMWEDDYKLIHFLEEKQSLLFNLKEDPDELNNLFNKEPEVGQRLLALIQDNLKKANERISREE